MIFSKIIKVIKKFFNNLNKSDMERYLENSKIVDLAQLDYKIKQYEQEQKSCWII